MEESLCRQFRGDRHKGMLTMGQGTLLQIRVLTGKGLQVKQGWLSVITVERKLAFLADNGDIVIPAQASQEIPSLTAFQTDDLDAFDSDCDDAPSAKVVLMANHSSFDSYVLSEYSNIILYEQYLKETKNPVVQSISSSAQQDELLTAVIKEMSIQVAKCNKVQQENLIGNETLTAELERYKEQVKLFEQRQKFDLNDREKYIDGQLRKVIVDRNAKVADFEKQIHSLKLQLNATIGSHKNLSTMVECLKKEYKQKEVKYLDEVIDLQKKNKALDNVVYKMGQSTQTMHMLTEPQAFYDENGHTIVKTHDALSVTDTEETLELVEESRLKMLAKQNDPSLKEKKVNIAPVDYVALNKLSEHFVKNFVPKKQLPAEQKEIPHELPSINKKYFEIEKKEINLDNDRLLENIIYHAVMNIMMHADSLPVNVLPINNKYIVHICVNSLATLTNYAKMEQDYIDEYKENLMLKAELSKKEHMSIDNRDAHIDYIKHSREHADTLREIVKHARALRPLDSYLESACKIVQRIQEVLVYVKDTCPCLTKPSEKLVAATPLNKNKKVRFAEPATSSSNTHKQVDSHKTQDSNKPVLPSTGMKSSTSASRSQPSGNTKNNRISQTTSRNPKNKVEDHPRSVKSNSNKKNRVIEPICEVFTDMGYKWKPLGWTFTIDGNTFPLSRIASTKVEPLKKTTSKSVTTPKPEIKIYHRKTKVAKSVNLSNECSILGSRHSNILEPNKNWGSTASNLHPLLLSISDGAGLLFGSRDTNLYTISLDDMLKSSPIFLLSKASKTKSWLWHRRLSHLNLGTLNQLAKQGLVRGLPKLKFEKDHLCSTCSLGKSKKSSHKPKADDTN
ncbi:retrovirus-related pol polyprotein from transposon TNT 1-94 [Tanacetum coccineum]